MGHLHYLREACAHMALGQLRLAPLLQAAARPWQLLRSRRCGRRILSESEAERNSTPVDVVCDLVCDDAWVLHLDSGWLLLDLDCLAELASVSASPVLLVQRAVAAHELLVDYGALGDWLRRAVPGVEASVGRGGLARS